MKTKLVLFAVAAAVALHGEPAEQHGSQTLPRFNGYMGSGSEQWFALTANNPDGSLLKQAWIKVGQEIAGFEIVSFDRKSEMLTLKNPAGNSVQLAMVDSKVRSAGEPPKLSRDDARQYAANEVATYLKKIRSEHPDRDVLVNPNLAAMPEGERQKFMQRQESFKQRTGGAQYLIPFRSADGRWGTALSVGEARNLPPPVLDSLSEDDRREFSAAYSIARAEEVARSVPPRVKP